jgi:hypothetical protein
VPKRLLSAEKGIFEASLTMSRELRGTEDFSFDTCNPWPRCREYQQMTYRLMAPD